MHNYSTLRNVHYRERKKDEKVFVLFLVAICLVLGVLRQSTDWLAGKFVSKMTLMCGVGHFNSTETGFPHM